MDILDWMPDPGSPLLLALIGTVSFVLAFIGSAAGLVLGHLRLPLLIRYMSSPIAGSAANLLVSGAGALAGTVRHLRDGRVSLHVLVLMGLPSVVGAALAAFVFSRHVADFWAHLVIGVMLFVSGVNLIWRGKGDAAVVPPGRYAVAGEVLIGLALGALAAVTGLMLGSLRLPMMIKWLRIDPKVAVGSNMAIGCMTALVAAATTFFSVKEAIWGPIGQALVVLVPPTVAGGYLGSWVTGRLRKESVQALAGWIILVTGGLMTAESVRDAARKGAKAPEATYDLTEEDDWLDSDADDD